MYRIGIGNANLWNLKQRCRRACETLHFEVLETRLALSASPSFDRTSGYYDSAFHLQVSSQSLPGVTVHYTLDGSVPSFSSPQYVSPIYIATTTPVRAVAIKDGLHDSIVTTATFIFLNDVLTQDHSYFPPNWGNNPGRYEFDQFVVSANSDTIVSDLKSLPAMAITLSPSDFENIYSGSGGRPKVAVEMFDESGTYFSIDAGIQRQGNTSLGDEKPSWRLYFDDVYGSGPTNRPDLKSPKQLEFPVFGNNAALEFDKLQLRSGGQDGWGDNNVTNATYLRDRMAADIQNSFGGAAPHGSFVQVYLNGLYWGLYNLHERPDEHFAEAYFGGDNDDYVFINANSTNGTSGYSEWQSLLYTVEHGDYAAINEVLDVPSFADYVLTNVFAQNWDWTPNWTATLNANANGRWQFHAWDSDRTFSTLMTLSPSLPTLNNPRNIFSSLKRFEDFNILLGDRAQAHLFNDGYLNAPQGSAAWNALAAGIRSAVISESARWGDGQTIGDWEAEVASIDAYYFAANAAVIDEVYFYLSNSNSLLNKLQFHVNSLPQYGGQITPGIATTLEITGTAQLAPNQHIYFTLDGSDPRLPGGAISPSAILYSGYGIPLLDTTHVRARLFTNAGSGSWSAILESTFLGNAPATSDNLAITEIMYHPANPTAGEIAAGFVDGNDFEFIELRNTGASSIDLAGVEFVQGIRFTFTPQSLFAHANGRTANPLTLATGESIVVVSNAAAFAHRYASEIDNFNIRIAGEFSYYHALSNGGELLRLLGGNGEVIQQFAYSDDIADGDGYSLEVKNVRGDYGDAGNWQAGAMGGSPGYRSENGPRVENVTIRSVAASQHSHVMESGPDQLKSISVGNPSVIEIAFSVPLDPLTVDIYDLQLANLTTGVVFTPASAILNLSNTIVTWSFAAPFPMGQYLIMIRDANIHDLSGGILDGEWVNPTSHSSGVGYSAMPSGNGYAGGDFNFAFTVLPGDFVRDNDNKVNQFDLSRLAANFGQFANGGASYADGDANGDGYVDQFDVSALSANFNRQLANDLALSGDITSDGIINMRDLTVFLRNRGSVNVGLAGGDINGDGQVDDDDLDLLFSMWGMRVMRG